MNDEQVSTFRNEDTFRSNSTNIWCPRKKRKKGENKNFRRQMNNSKSVNNYLPGVGHVSKFS